MGSDAPAGLSASLHGECERIWASLHAHPFLRELASGKLPLEKFRFFIEQDWVRFYLTAGMADLVRARGLVLGHGLRARPVARPAGRPGPAS